MTFYGSANTYEEFISTPDECCTVRNLCPMDTRSVHIVTKKCLEGTTVFTGYH